ncbi:acyltransferase [Halocatena halophila]|uniref:acyltransferase n=1 Tax=Halocatena halophila TaxID=2814576 RepID=UPI002ED294FD
MTSENTHDVTASTEGPRLLETRPIAGILVHPLALLTMGVGAGICYLVSSNEFTRANARNALDWHLTVWALMVTAFGAMGGGAVVAETSVISLPPLAGQLTGILFFALFALLMVVLFWTLLAGGFATLMAAFGTVWRYPLSVAVVDRLERRGGVPGGWLGVIVGYVVLTPLVMAGVLTGPHGGPFFFLSFAGVAGLTMVGAPLAVVAVYRHGIQGRATQPRPAGLTIAIPVVIALAGFVLRSEYAHSLNPSGDAIYIFFVAFWLSLTCYLWKTTRDRDSNPQPNSP